MITAGHYGLEIYAGVYFLLKWNIKIAVFRIYYKRYIGGFLCVKATISIS